MRQKFGSMREPAMAAIALAAAASLFAPSAMAQRNPAYEQARSEGQIGEQADGYLGIVTSAPPAVRDLVRDINLKRKDAYTKGAPSGSTIENFAFVTGCNLIANTKPGEKYKTPDPGGRWLTRDNSPPVRHPSCP